MSQRLVRSIKGVAAWVQVHVEGPPLPRRVNLSPANDPTIGVVWLHYSYFPLYEHKSLQVFSETAEGSGFPSARPEGNRVDFMGGSRDMRLRFLSGRGPIFPWTREGSILQPLRREEEAAKRHCAGEVCPSRLPLTPTLRFVSLRSCLRPFRLDAFTPECLVSRNTRVKEKREGRRGGRPWSGHPAVMLT